MNAAELEELLFQLRACREACYRTRGKSLREAWAECNRGDWMLWLVGKMADEAGWPTRRQIVLATCACARTALRFVRDGEERPLKAIETAERWARGKATIDDVRHAAIGAAAAARIYASFEPCVFYSARAASSAAMSVSEYHTASSTAEDVFDAFSTAGVVDKTPDVLRRELHFAALEEEEA